MTVLEQVALGFDAAKITIYNYMRKVYPKIDQSRSTLLNAFVSGVAYLYSMFQVFAKLLQDELYVATATELESLYKLLPFVGMPLDQPLTIKIIGSASPQNPDITLDSTVLYMDGESPFTDSDANKFYPRSQTITKRKIFTFDLLRTQGLVSTNEKFIELSIAQIMAEDSYIPASQFHSISITDTFTIEVPYIKNGTMQKAVLTWQDETTLTTTGSTVPGDVDTTNCSFDSKTGYVKVAFSDAVLDVESLVGQVINLSMVERSIYRKDFDRTSINLSTLSASNSNSAAYYINIYNRTAAAAVRDEISLIATNTNKLIDVRLGLGIDPTTLKIQNIVVTDVKFDFSQATVKNDQYWGMIYEATCTYLTVDYHAYILDAYQGIIFFEDPIAVATAGSRTIANYTIDYSESFGSKILLEQFEWKNKAVRPTAEFNFDALTYTFEDTDIILFDEIQIKIGDSSLAAIVFEQVPDVSVITGTASKAYFEAQPLSPTKVQLRFENSVQYSSVDNMVITYKAVKQLDNYQSGTQLAGAVNLYTRTGSAYATSVANFDVVNEVTAAGVGGVPALETLRLAMEKSAYTFDRYVTRTNYEAAILSWFVNTAQADARIKVFDYQDFGTAFLNSVNGNIVYFLGLKNRFINSDPVLVVPTELSADMIGNDSSTQYTREELALQIPGLTPTDIGEKIVVRIGSEETGDIDDLRTALNGDKTITDYIFSDPSFVRMYSVFFKLKIRAKVGYTFAEADTAVRNALAALFKWSVMQFVRDLNVSDVYAALDGLPQVEKVILLNMSHNKNDSANITVQDISYKTMITPAIATSFVMKISAFVTGNRLSLTRFPEGFSLTAILEAKYGGDGAVIHLPYLATAYGFSVGMRITTSGFTNAGNNLTGVLISVVSGNDITITGGTFSTNESKTATIRYVKGFKLGGNATKLQVGFNATSLGFAITDKVSILNAATGNIITGLAITGISSDTAGTNNILEFSSAPFATEEFVDARIVAGEFAGFITAGVGTDRRLTLTGFSTNGTITNVRVETVSEDDIILNLEDKVLADESNKVVTFSAGNDRIENPLWDFSEVATTRVIEVDVLGLGGIETESY